MACLPSMTNGEMATLTDPRVRICTTQPPPRYNEGTLIDAMQNAWRFVEDPTLKERLKEAKGIGTPATRAEIIKGLKAQNLLTAMGKLVIPTPSGLKLYEVLSQAAPSLVDPGTTAQWEMRLDDVVIGRTDFRAVIDGIAQNAEDLINRLQKNTALKIALAPSSQRGRGARRNGKKNFGTKTTRRRSTNLPAQRSFEGGQTGELAPPAHEVAGTVTRRSSSALRKPTPKMINYARSLAQRAGVPLPSSVLQDFGACRAFLQEHVQR